MIIVACYAFTILLRTIHHPLFKDVIQIASESSRDPAVMRGVVLIERIDSVECWSPWFIASWSIGGLYEWQHTFCLTSRCSRLWERPNNEQNFTPKIQANFKKLKVKVKINFIDEPWGS